MIRILVFDMLNLAVILYAMSRGGGPERLAALLLLAARLATLVMPFDYHSTFRTINWGNFLVDLSLLVALMLLATRANRFWPMWMASIQLLTIGMHAVRVYDVQIIAIVYSRLSGQLAYPMLAMLALGVWRHRQRLSAFGSDPSWSALGRPADEYANNIRLGDRQ